MRPPVAPAVMQDPSTPSVVNADSLLKPLTNFWCQIHLSMLMPKRCCSRFVRAMPLIHSSASSISSKASMGCHIMMACGCVTAVWQCPAVLTCAGTSCGSYIAHRMQATLAYSTPWI